MPTRKAGYPLGSEMDLLFEVDPAPYKSALLRPAEIGILTYPVRSWQDPQYLFLESLIERDGGRVDSTQSLSPYVRYFNLKVLMAETNGIYMTGVTEYFGFRDKEEPISKSNFLNPLASVHNPAREQTLTPGNKPRAAWPHEDKLPWEALSCMATAPAFYNDSLMKARSEAEIKQKYWSLSFPDGSWVILSGTHPLAVIFVNTFYWIDRVEELDHKFIAFMESAIVVEGPVCPCRGLGLFDYLMIIMTDSKTVSEAFDVRSALRSTSTSLNGGLYWEDYFFLVISFMGRLANDDKHLSYMLRKLDYSKKDTDKWHSGRIQVGPETRS